MATRTVQTRQRLTFSLVESDPAGPIVVEALALPWDREVEVGWWGDRLSFAPGSVTATGGVASRVKFLLDHRTHKPFGYGLEFSYRDETDQHPAGLWARMAVPRDELEDPEVDRAVKQMLNGVRDAVSVGVDLTEYSEEPLEKGSFAQRIRVAAAELLELSSCVIPRFTDARVTSIAASHQPPGATMPTATDRFAHVSPTDPDPTDPPDDGGDEEVRRRNAHLATLAPLPATMALVGGPLARFASFAEYARARWSDPTIPSLTAALADQITGNNPGVVPPAWLTEVKGIIDMGRPLIGALGGARPAPESGMDVDWPYFDGDLYALVGEQAAQKTEIVSVRVDLKRATAALKTYAGGSDIALQLIQRSSPSYLDAYLRIMSAAYAAVTDKAAGIALNAASGNTLYGADLSTVEGVAAALFEASSMVNTATGSPATVVAMATDVFLSVGPLVLSLTAPTGNTANASASAASLNVNVAGLKLTEVPHFQPGQFVVTNALAAAWLEDGPQTISELDVARLGRDVAVWGMGVMAPFIADGIVHVTSAAAPPLGARGGKKSAD